MEKNLGRLEPDTVTGADYSIAYKGLLDFTRVNPNSIQNLEDLQAHAGIVGNDLKKIILSNGKVQSTVGGQIKHKAYAIDLPINDHHIYATIDSLRPNSISITAHKNGHRIMHASLSSNDILDSPYSDDPYAIDYRNKRRDFYPKNAPDDQKTMKGFASTLQLLCKDLLSVVPKPGEY